MPRIEPLTGSRQPLMLRLMQWYSRRRFGKEALPPRILAHNARFLLPYTSLAMLSTGKSEIDPGIRQLAMHRVAEVNGCGWCIDFGNKIALDMGLTPEKLMAVSDFADSPLFSSSERTALACADEMARNHGQISEATFDEMQRHFSNREIIELIVAVAAEGLYNQVNIALEIESEGFCAVPLRQLAHAAA